MKTVVQCTRACWEIFHILFATNDAQMTINNMREITKYCDKLKGFNFLPLLLYILMSLRFGAECG